MNDLDIEALAKIAYDSYGHAVNYRNYQGKPMPIWEDLTDTIRNAWMKSTEMIAKFVRPIHLATAESQCVSVIVKGIDLQIAILDDQTLIVGCSGTQSDMDHAMKTFESLYDGRKRIVYVRGPLTVESLYENHDLREMIREISADVMTEFALRQELLKSDK